MRSMHQFTPEIDRLPRAFAYHCMNGLAMRAPLDTSLTPEIDWTQLPERQ